MTPWLLLIGGGVLIGLFIAALVDKFLDEVNRDYRDSEDS